MYQFKVPEGKKIRVIINADAKCEADDQYAIVHALLTPQFDIKGIIGAHFGSWRFENSMLESVKECEKILALMEIDHVKVFKGADKAVVSRNEFIRSEGSDLIVREALAVSDQPLFVTFQGPLTDLACAYLTAPEIVGKFTAIWIGGDKYPDGGRETNLGNDIEAARIIMDSDIDLWQVPKNVYERISVGLAELEVKVRPYGKIGKYLFDQLIQLNIAMKKGAWPKGEMWMLGDQPCVGLLLDAMNYAWEYKKAPIIGNDMTYSFTEGRRDIRVYNTIDSRFILEDLFAKLKLTYDCVENK